MSHTVFSWSDTPSAVLVAIAIPIFTNQLEKAREATDAANIRAAYAEVVSAKLTGEGDTEKTIVLKQQQDGWQNSFEFPANLTDDKDTPLTKEQKDVKITATESGVSINIKLTK